MFGVRKTCRDLANILREIQQENDRLKAKNAKLLDEKIEAYNDMVAATLEADELRAKNAKLRELVRDMMRFFEDGDWCTTCEQACKCESQEQYEEDCLMRDVFHHRMRELEIEVDG